jgi:hypothetical protein
LSERASLTSTSTPLDKSTMNKEPLLNTLLQGGHKRQAGGGDGQLALPPARVVVVRWRRQGAAASAQRSQHAATQARQPATQAAKQADAAQSNTAKQVFAGILPDPKISRPYSPNSSRVGRQTRQAWPSPAHPKLTC